MKIRLAGTEVRTAGQTGGQRDRHDEASSRFLQLCEAVRNRSICMNFVAHQCGMPIKITEFLHFLYISR